MRKVDDMSFSKYSHKKEKDFLGKVFIETKP